MIIINLFLDYIKPLLKATSSLSRGAPIEAKTENLHNDKHERLKLLTEQRHISINKLMEEISTIVLAEFDAEMRFRARAARGSPKEGLHLPNRGFDPGKF